MTYTEATNPIQILPEHLINQIKAGEVIERPANLIKELIENSIDAGSTTIDIVIENNGLDTIIISDNGRGIDFKQMPLAFERHATSKLIKFDDLFHLISYGFRGEALASMASISRLTCKSSTADENENAGQIVINGGHIESHINIFQKTHGTTIHIKDLFYNTPARLKFVKSKSAEKNSIKRVLSSYALAHENIAFSIKWDEKDKEIYNGPQEKRLEKILFKNSKNYLAFTKSYQGYTVNGYLAKEAKSGGLKNQFIFVNDRLIEDKAIHKTVLYSSIPMWSPGQYGPYCLFLQVPMEKLDVNVHPAKTAIKFEEASLITGLITSAIKSAVKEEQQKSKRDQYPPTEFLDNFDSLKDSNQDLQETKFSSFHFNAPTTTGPNKDQFNQIIDDQFRILTQVSESYALVQYGNNATVYALDIPGLLKIFLTDRLSNELTENDIIPLFISEPLTIMESIDDNSLKFLKRLGLDCEVINTDTIILRSIPSALEDFHYSRISQSIISFLQDKTFSHFQQFKKSILSFLQNDIELSVVSVHSYLGILNTYGLNPLAKRKILLAIDQHLINSTFDLLRDDNSKEQ